MDSQGHAPADLPPGKQLSTHYAGGSVGPRAGMDGRGEKKIFPPPGFEPRTVQAVASRYTDWANSPLPYIPLVWHYCFLRGFFEVDNYLVRNTTF